MAEYNSWNIYDNVIIVENYDSYYPNYEERQYPSKGYIVDPNNKSMLDSAHKWADKHFKWNYDKSTNTYKSTIDYTGEEHHMKNDFKLSIVGSADGSSQGGKLSFWTVLVENEDKKFLVGVQSDSLCSLIKHSTFINGTCTERVFFARKNGQVCVLTKSMPEYIEALNDINKRKTTSTSKTTKWQIGHNYITATCDDVYVCDVYKNYELICRDIYRNGWTYSSPLAINYKPEMKQPYVKSRREDVNKLSDYTKDMPEKYYIKDKFPSRTMGDFILDYDLTTDELNNIQHTYVKNTLNECNLKYQKNGYIANYDIINLCYSYTPDFKFDNEEIELLKKLNIDVYN